MLGAFSQVLVAAQGVPNTRQPLEQPVIGDKGMAVLDQNIIAQAIAARKTDTLILPFAANWALWRSCGRKARILNVDCYRAMD